LAAIRSWSYICQRPDWVLARAEMAARARAAEARLSDALHQRLTERFVNRRTAVLMKSMGRDPALLRVALDESGRVTVEDQPIGHLEGFRFVVDAMASSEDRKLMLAAAEKHLPHLLALKAQALVRDELGELVIEQGEIRRDGRAIARLERGKSPSRPRVVLEKTLGLLDRAHKARLTEALGHWLDGELEPLAPLRAIETAALDPEAGSEVRALLLTLADGHGVIPRERADLARVPKDRRPFLRRLGVMIGALDVFMPALLKPSPRHLLRAVGADPRPLRPGMEAVIEGARELPAGYRRAGGQAIRVDLAEKLFRTAHDQRAKAAGRAFRLDLALATSMGLQADNARHLLRDAGFRPGAVRALPVGGLGPPAPLSWSWRPPRRDALVQRPEVVEVAEGSAFAALAGLMR
ncbi:MAG: helicase, partial [Croceibacterium sp.]